jgi:polyphosphate kinase
VLEEAQDPSVPLLERVKFTAIFSANLVFMLLEDVLRVHLPGLDDGHDVLSSHVVRVTRDATLHTSGGSGGLLASIERGVRQRRLGAVVRVERDPGLPSEVLTALGVELGVSPEDVYESEGLTDFSDLSQLYAAVDLPRMKDRPRPPRPVPAFERAPDVWSAIRARDVLVHHPYHAFHAVTRFVRDAAVDPAVRTIKMTLYRVSATSPIAQALRTAVENGKEVLPDGTSVRVAAEGEASLRSQERLYEATGRDGAR